MTNFTKFAAVALAALVVSTSLASAGGLTIKPGLIKNVKINVQPINALSPQLGNQLLGSDPYLQACIKFECKPTTIKFPIPISLLPKKPTIKFPLIPINLYPKLPAGQQPNPQLAVDCEVHSVAPTTDDLFIINTGNTQLPSGTQINFRVASSGDQGGFLLPASIDVGAKLKVSGLLHAAQSGAPCAVKIVS
jgi:hypothetical protein